MRSSSITSGSPPAALRRLAEDPDKLLWRYLDSPVKLGHTSLVVKAELPMDDGPLSVCYKRYRPRDWWKAFCGQFRRSRALRGWRLGHALLARGIATARPLAVCQSRRGHFRRSSYLATEWIEGAENLHLWGWRLASCRLSERLRRAAPCAESLGRLVGRMHAWQINHRDLKGSNLLVAEGDRGLRTYLVDTDGARLRRRFSAARQVRDLARLAASIEAHPWVTRTLRCRFLRTYVRQLPQDQVDWKTLWREVAAASRRMVRRKRRRREPVL